ncbi:Altered inheritance of mitochondria protein 18 mitochondrial [Umbelopsis sp. WA50703]
MGTSFLLSNVVQTEAATSETIEEPMTHMQFPLTIHNGTDQKVILGLGSRQVSFLKLNVYVMGMYVSPKDARVLRKAGIWTDAQAAMDSMDQAQQMLKQPIDIAIRIVPTRATGAQHLRDGFTRSLLQLMHDHSKDLTEEDERQIIEGIQDFKAKFPSSKVNKGDEFIFTRTATGGLKIEFRGKELGIVSNRWVADNFVVGYVKLGIVKNVLENAYLQ